jgi:predicted nucleic acid-binding protein
MTLVVDASVAVEYLLRSPLGKRAAPLLEAADLLGPELLDVEVLSVLRRESLAGRLSEARAREALSDLRAWDLERLSHAGLLLHAWRLRDDLTAYDALYVAAARLYDADLVTADGPLSRAPGLGVAIHNIRVA